MSIFGIGPDASTPVERAEAYRKAHAASDVDAEPSSLHHTIGRGPNQVAQGNHGHTKHSPSDEPPLRPAVGDEWIVTNKDNLKRVWNGVIWEDVILGSQAIGVLNADNIDVNFLNGKTIVGVIIEGGTIKASGELVGNYKTAASGQRVELSSDFGSGYSRSTIVLFSGAGIEDRPAIIQSIGNSSDINLQITGPGVNGGPFPVINMYSDSGLSELGLFAEIVDVGGYNSNVKMPSKLQAGSISLNIDQLNYTNSHSIYFSEQMYAVPSVIVNAQALSPSQVFCTATGINRSGFNLTFRREAGNTGFVTFNWIAVAP